MDDINTFISKLEREIEELQPGSLRADTVFRHLPEWSSMHALIVIALAETEYDTTITGEDLKKSTTIQDIYEIIRSRAH
ncbi:MAG: hypothetical protein Fur0041_07890 [Bacteroidia bacterium]